MSAIDDIAAERRRQVTVEGWPIEHDDDHAHGEMARAAAAYAVNASNGACSADVAENLWPWGFEWFKPKDPRRDLVRAGALIVAEIERLDRKAKASLLSTESST